MKKTLIVQLGQNKDLVFGLEWKTLVGVDLARKSNKEAALNKATHFIRASEHFSAMGLVKLNKADGLDENRILYSAAAVFALSNSTGTFVSNIELFDGCHWVVAALDGGVIKGTDVLLDASEAEKLVAELHARFPEAKLGVDERDSSPFLNEKTRLIKHRNSIQSLPDWVKVLSVGVIALILGKYALNYWELRQEKEAMDNNIEQYVDVKGEWAKSLDDWAGTVHVDGQEGFNHLYENIVRTPVTLGGWLLTDVECAPRSREYWMCRARYSRGPTGTNASLQNSIGQDWSIAWDGLSNAHVSWSIDAKRTQIDRQKIVDKKQFNIDFISALQNVLPAYNQVILNPAEVVSFRNPVTTNSNGDSVDLAYPSDNKGIEIPNKHTLVASAPFRSLSVMPIPEHMVVKKLSIKMKDFDTPSALSTGYIAGELTGEMYVK